MICRWLSATDNRPGTGAGAAPADLDEPDEGVQPNIVAEIGEHFFLMEKGRVVANGEMANLNADLISRHLAA
jgi:ABC-type branched-subunit amino acid transport system ATPase component